MLETVTDAVSLLHYANTSVFPTTDNSSEFTPDHENNITKPHRCLQILYDDIGRSRYAFHRWSRGYPPRIHRTGQDRAATNHYCTDLIIRLWLIIQLLQLVKILSKILRINAITSAFENHMWPWTIKQSQGSIVLQIEIYRSSESWINNISIDVWFGQYLKIWNLRVQKNLNIEKIIFKVVLMKFLAMHINNQ